MQSQQECWIFVESIGKDMNLALDVTLGGYKFGFAGGCQVERMPECHANPKESELKNRKRLKPANSELISLPCPRAFPGSVMPHLAGFLVAPNTSALLGSIHQFS